MRSVIALAGAFATLCACAFFALFVGAAHITVRDILLALAHPSSQSVDARILWEVRLPRICIGVFVGCALGIGGALLQTLLCNPLVDPYITGVSAGAGAAIAVGIACGLALPWIPALGFAAGVVAALAVVALSSRAGRIDTQRMILAGLFVSSFLSAIVTVVLTRMEPSGATNAIIAWLAGSLAGHGWNELRWSAPYAAFGLALAACTLPALNVMRLGERRADSLGVSVARTQYLVIASASLLTSAAVTLSGMIGFVGLLSPHIARRAVGGDVRFLAPCAALVGGAIVTIADVAARTLAPPGELPIGALIALFGVPAFFFIIMRENPERRRAPSASPHVMRGTTRLHGKELA